MVKPMGTNKVKAVIEPGEELLHRRYSFLNEAERRATVLACEDGGSTQTRGFLIDREELGEFGKYLDSAITIPSSSASVVDDRVIAPNSPDLYDNLESQVVNTTTAQTDPIFRHNRLVRGSKSLNVEMYENRLGSSTQKTSDPTYYFNLLDAIGYQALLKYGERVPVQLTVYLAVSLPPDDLNEINQKKFRDNMRSFKWTHSPSGVSIQIDIEAIYTMTEPEAFAKGYYNLTGDGEIPDFILHIEGGGRSIGAEILRYGTTLKGGQKTLEFGGNQLLNFLNDSYVNKYGGKRLSDTILYEAIKTGKVRFGNEVREVIDLIKIAKRQMAEKIFAEIRREVFDAQSKVSMEELNSISVSGRLFDEGEYGVSVATYLQQLFKNVTPATEFVRLEGNLIPQGLLLESMVEFFPEVLGIPTDEEDVQAEVAVSSEE